MPLQSRKYTVGGRPASTGSWEAADAFTVRWTEDPLGLSQEECARKGIEAVAGFVVSNDVFGTDYNPGEMFCVCVDLYHAGSEIGGDSGDYVDAYFRTVEFRDSTYPLVGQPTLSMRMRPLSDGSVGASWNAVDMGPNGEAMTEVDMAPVDPNPVAVVCSPLPMGEIPEQGAGDGNPPSFLLLRDPGAGWQIWRRYADVVGDGKPAVDDGFREESYVMVYPMLSADMGWRFRVYDPGDGGVRVEVNPASRSRR